VGEKDSKIIRATFERAGLTINEEKSDWNPAYIKEYIGVVWNTIENTVALTEARREKIKVFLGSLSRS
jgi:hypothetical protein